ncbi:hypothetical protein DFP77_13516 [Marinomonas foliarum]|uniref:Uncharacterized protein n=1 Tax=Marinomonas foliarum TaxID=491950 RepID=A0A368ZMS4_9GAMM|nr:hypothetical protein DFP77_13516 [Marinomonas foliarum]
MIDHQKLQKLVGQLYSAVSELGRMFPGRHFPPKKIGIWSGVWGSAWLRMLMT